MPAVYWIHHPDHVDILTQGYVGFTSKPVKKRISEHVCLANKNAMRSVHLENAIRKHGISGLLVKTMCIGSAEYCLDIERKLRPTHGIGWNLSIGGDKPAIGRVVTESTRKKLSESSSRLIMSEDAREKIRQKALGNKRGLGKKMSPEHKEKLRNINLGKKHSEETKKKQSELRRGRKKPEGFGLGRRHSEETRAKMSASMRGAKQRKRMRAVIDFEKD